MICKFGFNPTTHRFRATLEKQFIGLFFSVECTLLGSRKKKPTFTSADNW